MSCKPLRKVFQKGKQVVRNSRTYCPTSSILLDIILRVLYPKFNKQKCVHFIHFFVIYGISNQFHFNKYLDKEQLCVVKQSLNLNTLQSLTKNFHCVTCLADRHSSLEQFSDDKEMTEKLHKGVQS